MMDGTDHFPRDYRQGRARFREACEAAGLGVTSRVHPGETGPDGKPLFMDVACAGPREAENAVLLISGTHGVEGYFGSGVQTGLLREGLCAKLPKGARLVLLHALNPFGFAWDRRVNEDNADINRNFVDHTKPPGNAAYDLLADDIAPKDISQDAIKAANARLADYAVKHGPFALQTAISAGQYRHADGIYFGGIRESWSAAMLRDVLKEHLAHVRKLIVIDYHTGLGECGAAEMITEDLPNSAEYKRQRAIWGGRVASSEAGESLSAPLTGTIDKALAKLLARVELTFAALEVGTAPMRDVFHALRMDNWLHLNARPGHDHWNAVKQEIRAAFYPDTPEWKRAVWRHAAETFTQALASLA